MKRVRYTAIGIRMLAVVLLLPLWLTGCIKQRITEEDRFFDKWEARAETAKGYSPPGYREVQQAQERLLQADLQARPVATPGPEDEEDGSGYNFYRLSAVDDRG